MNGFTKLFGSIITSTLWREDDKTRIVWITMLALTDQYGVVSASIPGLAAVANVTIADCESAISKLSAPDIYSRSKEYNGCRIEACDGGWKILNYVKYREKGRSVDRTEYFRENKRKQREKNVHTLSTNVNQCQPIAEAEADDKALSSLSHTKPPASKPTKTNKLSQTEKELADRIEVMLGIEWVNDAGKWVNRIKAEPHKSQRVFNELESAIHQGRITTTPAAFAEDTWKRF